MKANKIDKSKTAYMKNKIGKLNPNRLDKEGYIKPKKEKGYNKPKIK